MIVGMNRRTWLVACSIGGSGTLGFAADSGPSMTAPRWRSLNDAVAAALDDAMRLSGLDASAIEVVSAENVTWRDGSLGCPQPGRVYTQALVPGYRVRLRARGELLDYHAGRHGALVLCPAGRADEPLVEQAQR
jgi:hypothetical protein